MKPALTPCVALQAPEVGLPAPDLVFFLELSVRDAAARGGFGAERYAAGLGDHWLVVNFIKSHTACHCYTFGLADGYNAQQDQQ